MSTHSLESQRQLVTGTFPQTSGFCGSFQTCAHEQFLRPPTYTLLWLHSPFVLHLRKWSLFSTHTLYCSTQFLITHNYLGLGVGLRPYQIYTTVQTIIIHRSWFYNPLLTISWETHYSDPYTVESNPHKQNQNQSPPQNPDLDKELIL